MLSAQRRAFTFPNRRRQHLFLLLLPLGLLYYQVCLRYDTRPGSSRPRTDLPVFRKDDLAHTLGYNQNLTVNLVIASLSGDDISWTQDLKNTLPNLQVVRYVSDFSPSTSWLSKFHPPVPRKGREATIYHTYFHDFYHDLPDISIMVHADPQPWHVEGLLQQSLVFTLNHLDLTRVPARGGYANLRVTWQDSCPAWIDTTLSVEQASKKEEPFMRAAFKAAFPGEKLPDTFAGPCCAQFAVTREAIQRNPRAQYERIRSWLINTKMSNYIVGRTWEHMWPWLFLRQAPHPFSSRANINCPLEWATYCSMYGVCLGDSSSMRDNQDIVRSYNTKWAYKEALRRDHIEEWWNRLLHPFKAAHAVRLITQAEKHLEGELLKALQRGSDRQVRDMAFESLLEG